ncbi:MAG: ATP-binding protein [Chloroflexi bacterium]|nr:ATP-binding protein [Chloroflexota bacterium]MCL5274815.1 ATP-binding protein [Chloroflexota bacterium]
MSLFSAVRRRLAWKLFLSYLVIISVGVLVLAATSLISAPNVLEYHMAQMAMMGSSPALLADLRSNFVTAINEVMAVAAGAAFIAAVLVSLFTAQRIVEPLRAVIAASRRIATGDYHQRVPLPGDDELGELARSFNQMAGTIEQTEQRRVELIGNVAHELRTPLSSIRSTMEGLIDGVLPAEPATFLDVQREVTRLQRLVQDLEELSRAEAGQIQLDLRPTDIAALLRAVTNRLSAQYEDKGVRLDAAIPATLAPLRVDAARMTQVLINLLGNALQYTPAGGTVRVEAAVAGRELRIDVRDTGVGIAAGQLPHVFERFYRVDRSRSRAGGGSGIGLTISKYLVEAHGGRIQADSPGVGRGSTFTVCIPLT